MLAGSSSDAGTLRFWTATDALGAYTLEGLPGGEYLLRNAAHEEYPSTHITARTGADYADLVVLKNMVTVAEGQVLSSEGWPLEGASVLPILTGQPNVLTGSDGRFRLPVKLNSSLAKFSLRFQMPGYHEQIVAVDLRHHDASNNASIDVLMRPVAAWTSVTGDVSNELGEPLAGRTVQFRSMSTRQAYQTTTNSDGHYTFDAVEAPADFRVLVFGAPGHVEHQQTVHVATDSGKLNIVAQRLEYGTLSGMLVNPAGMPVPDFELVLRSSGSYVADTLVRTDKLGNFEILAVPAGDIVVASQSNPSILVQGFHLSAGEKRHLPLVVDWGEHRIRGLVLDANGNPVPASRVVLRWSHEGEGIITEAIRRTAADIQGHFAFSNLGPGPHSLNISAPGFSGVDINHDLTQQGYDLTVKLN
jgi:protocatechuate 3,4-dioxygenase beta subunit